MKTLFISDLHLSDAKLGITKLFLSFLKEQSGHVDALYILGDLFEVWIGDDYDNAFNRSIINALKEFTKHGTPIYFIHGNRDFLIGEAFARRAGVKLLPDLSVIDLYGVKTLITHGDVLCTLDKRHQRNRKFLRNRFITDLFLRLPLKLRQKIASRMRRASQKHLSQLSAELMDVPTGEITRIMEKYNVKQLIYGHTHKPSIRVFQSGDKKRYCYVLSDWGEKGNMLRCSSDGSIDMVYF